MTNILLIETYFLNIAFFKKIIMSIGEKDTLQAVEILFSG